MCDKPLSKPVSPEVTVVYKHESFGLDDLPSNLLYKSHHISKLKCFSSRLAESIEAMC